MSAEARLVLLAPPERPAPSPDSGEGLADVEALMLSLATGDALDRCGAMVAEHLRTGGKRLRARLALATARALGVTQPAGVAWAAACELLHNASLVHDDIQDGDRHRRGQPTTWARHGVPQAINAGDLLLMLPGVAIDHVPASDAVRYQLSRALARYAARTVRGQSQEMALREMRRLMWSDYRAAAVGKTAALFGLPVYGACLLAGVERERAEELAQCFEDIGLIYQICDDVLDLFGSGAQRALGSDVREGKITALVAQHLTLYPDDEAWLLEHLDRPAADTTDAHIQAVSRRLRFGGALEVVVEEVYNLSRRLLDAPALASEPGLATAAHGLLERVLAPMRSLDPSLPQVGAK